MSPLRVGVVGASRRRQGLGPFVARELERCGATVACFQSTSPETRDAAERELRERYGVVARGYTELAAMLASEELDALAICSPAETHANGLRAAREAGLHALCEKPLLWGGDDLGGAADAVARGFDAAGLVLRENCQWPYTLCAFEALHPGVIDSGAERFEMRMQPANPGIGRLGDSLPHALSLLQAVAPGEAPTAEDVCFAESDAAARLVVEFAYRTAAARTAVRVELERIAPGRRREAAFAIDGHWATRRISGEDYRLSFADGERCVPVEDPLPLLVADFVRDAENGAASQRGVIAERMAVLGQLALAYRRWEAAG